MGNNTATITYTISNSNGLSGRDWDCEYATVEAAAEEIRRNYRWDDVVTSSWFADDDGDGNHTSSCCAYETQEECDRDDEGAHAPRITRHVEVVSAEDGAE